MCGEVNQISKKLTKRGGDGVRCSGGARWDADVVGVLPAERNNMRSERRARFVGEDEEEEAGEGEKRET
ncbi:hypothetical protein HAX54_013157, partial [Datura stramonium]|nr:hypothetical protein [Datura stramonium]